MADFIRELVSQNKIRYKGDGYDLDLTYITPNIIAMGFPARSFEAVYRNDAEEVVRFLDEKHPGHYFVINLCSERDYQYSPAQFHGRACSFPMADHGPPPFQMFLPFCRKVEEWLSVSPRNVVAVHCRAGKDRTGTMLAAYFLYAGMAQTAEEAIYLFTMQRTYDGRNVMIPSQKRYVKYFENLISPSIGSGRLSGQAYQPTRLLLNAIVISPPPTRAGFESDISYTVQSKASGLNYTSETHDLDRDVDPRSGQLVMVPPKPLPVCEDVKVTVHGRSLLLAKEELFRFWFNTFFVPTQKSESRKQILSGNGKHKSRQKSNPRSKSGCVSCQSNQQYLSAGSGGNFVSVVRYSSTEPRQQRGPPQAACGCKASCRSAPCQGLEKLPYAGPHGVMTLHKSEMEGGDKIGPQNLTATLFFADVAGH